MTLIEQVENPLDGRRLAFMTGWNRVTEEVLAARANGEDEPDPLPPPPLPKADDYLETDQGALLARTRAKDLLHTWVYGEIIRSNPATGQRVPTRSGKVELDYTGGGEHFTFSRTARRSQRRTL